MKAPQTPANESERLAALRALGVLDTPAEQAYDDVVRLASQLFQVPIALVSLIDTDRQWFKARVGLSATQTPRDVSFCGHAVYAEQTLVVPDAHADPRFADNPLVQGDPRVRFYAGAPLVTESGHVLGTLCVIDHVVRQPTEAQLETLESLARHVTSHLELRRRAVQSSFFERTLDMLCVAGTDGYFKLLNPAWSNTLGWTEEELLGRPFIEFVHPDDREATITEAAKLATGEHETVSFINRYECRDGSYRWLDWTAAPDASTQLLHAVAHDITEKQRMETVKDEFVSVVSHELRTPLTSIRGSLRLLEGGVAGKLSEQAEELITIASKNTDRLVRLINDILDLEKIEAGKMELSLGEVVPNGLLRRTAEAMQGLATERGVRLVIDGRGFPPLKADGDRLLQVTTNLVSNAIKFSPSGSEVRLGVDARGGCLRFTVTDQGVGLSDEDKVRVFSKFHQVDSSDTRVATGTGLGLSIARAIVLEHGGEMGVESELGNGAKFWFELPSAHRATPLPADLPEGDDPRLRHSVLIVEDDPDLVHVLRLFLSSQGYRVRAVAGVAEAREAIGAEVPDAVVLDLTLDDGDGMELVAWLRAREELAQISVIVMTGRDRDSKSCGEPMIVDWVQKPVDERRLTHALRLAVRAPGPARVLVAEDDEDVRQVLVKQLQELGAHTFEADTGLTAIERAREHHPDLIVLDVGLPGVDGFDVVDVLKQTRTRATPLVVFTGRELRAGERSALRLGLTRHLTKARTSEEEFSQAVSELLNGALERTKEAQGS